MLPEVAPHERIEPPGKTFLKVSGALGVRKLARGVFSGSEDEPQLIILFGMLPEAGTSACCNLGCRLHLLKEAADGIGWLGLNCALHLGSFLKMHGTEVFCETFFVFKDNCPPQPSQIHSCLFSSIFKTCVSALVCIGALPVLPRFCGSL